MAPQKDVRKTNKKLLKSVEEIKDTSSGSLQRLSPDSGEINMCENLYLDHGSRKRRREAEDVGEPSSPVENSDDDGEGRQEQLNETEVPIKDNIRSILYSCKGEGVKLKKFVTFSNVKHEIIDAVQSPTQSEMEHKNDDKSTAVPSSQIKPKNKKRKRKKKVNENKRKQSDATIESSVKSSRNERAIAYLETWKNDRSSWKFEKLTQIWLLKHMFNQSEVPDNIFKILLKYIVDIKGAGKTMAINMCQEMMKKMENSSSVENGPKTSLAEMEDQVSYKRARTLLRRLQ